MAPLASISNWLAGARPGSGEVPADACPSPGAIPIDPAAVFAPDSNVIESYSRFDPNDTENLRRARGGKVFYKDIPYSQYLGDWQFHPGRIGTYLTIAPLTRKLVSTANDIVNLCIELPNGGLALYYPRSVRTVRLLSNSYIYSGIAQGQLLAAYTRLLKEAHGGRFYNWRPVAAAIAKSLQFPFENGGVCVDNSIILEAPNFRSCPEIILNGWQDALLHLHDYLQISEDKNLYEFYDRNIAALADLLPDFDDEESHLSRYSNLCPYLFRVHFRRTKGKDSPPRVAVEYRSLKKGYASYWIPALWGSEGLKNCIYDNKIVQSRSSYMDLSLSASSPYEIRVHIFADCSRISFDPGSFDVTSSVPKRTYRTRSLAPHVPFNGQFTSFLVRPREHGLIPGCPTNFMKNGKENFYHVYHTVALYELAMTAREPSHRKILADFAERWFTYLSSSKHKHLGSPYVFSDPDRFVRTINRNRIFSHEFDFEKLRKHVQTLAKS